LKPQLKNYARALGVDVLLGWGWLSKYKMRIFEITSTPQTLKPLTPAQARIRSLKQSVERSRQQLSAERDRQRRQREAERSKKLQQQLG
jgi:hypothetical protein